MKALRKLEKIALVALIATGVALPVATGVAQPAAAAQESFGGFVPPAGWLPPPLDPTGVQLQTKELAPGVYALISPRPPVDNSGFIVGEKGVLVIDAHINGAMARQIQAAVRAVTDKPILYLVNTNYHGDHTFWNYAFPAETIIVAHRETAEAMADFEREKALLLPAVGGDATVFDDVRLRLPDVTFETSLRLDLGGRVVELHHFGPGNTPGDTVVYLPEAKIAWTGNLVLGAKSIPWAIEGGTSAYLETIARMAARLDVETIVGGHVLIAPGETLGVYLNYLSAHIKSVQRALGAGKTLEQTLASLPLDESYLPAVDSPLAVARPLMQGFHLWNVKRTYEELKVQARAKQQALAR